VERFQFGYKLPFEEIVMMSGFTRLSCWGAF